MGIEVYQNYLSYIPFDIYKLLIDNNILDGLKFPGTGVDPISSQRVVNVIKELGCTIDNHGFRGITGKLHDSRFFSDDFVLNKMLKDYLQLPGAGDVYSGHLGIPESRNLSEKELNEILKKNIIAIRNFIKLFNPTTNVKVYGEGVFPVCCSLETTRPEFLNQCASIEGGVDGLVLDLCHSLITTAYICKNEDSTYNFNRFLDDLRCDKVGIVHLSGGYKTPNKCGNFKNDDIMDPHMPCNLDDYSRLFSTLERCNNIFRLSNEIAYVCLDRNIDVSVKVYITEALLTRIAVETRDMKALSDARDYLSSVSFNNRDECNSVIKDVKRKYLTIK